MTGIAAHTPGRPAVGLRALVFVVGAASLGAEIAAARLLAPYFGASTIVWANTIAVVLLALSIGYWLGGRIADRGPRVERLATLVLIAAVALAAVPWAARPLLGLSTEAFDTLSAGTFAGSLLAVLVLVAGPVLLLGAVAPFAIRLSVSEVDASGRVAGTLYALSTIGSLVGTFAAALVLIPFAGTERTFGAFALALALVAAPQLRSRRALLVPALLCAALAVPPGTIKPAQAADVELLQEVETPYQYARVVQLADGTRRLELNEGHAIHSLLRPGSYLAGGYWDELLVLGLAPRGAPPRRVAMLGNAAGTVARAYGHYFPRTAVDAVEIDGELTRIGRRFFDMHGPRLHTITADARPFLRSTGERYDLIAVDAYRQPYIPFYLATREFFALCRERLAPGGVVAINVGHPAGSDALERVLTATLRSELPYVRRDPVSDTNTVLIASRSQVSASGVRLLAARAAQHGDLAHVAAATAARLAPALRGGDVYTDDRAPVEWLVNSSLLGFAARERADR